MGWYRRHVLDHEKGRYVLITSSKCRQSGFTLVELLVGIAVLGILLSIALPSFKAWLLNSQTRAAAESIENGLQIARSMALKNNQNVEFVLLPQLPNDETSWVVRFASDHVEINSRNSKEGSKSVVRTVSPVGATTVTFDNLGSPTVNADASLQFTEVFLNADPAALPVAQSQHLNIKIGVGGNMRMCDPNLPAPSPRAC
jgi:type IV fimbrial biogenesis protein FimT